jgi:hypothetical protein
MAALADMENSHTLTAILAELAELAVMELLLERVAC